MDLSALWIGALTRGSDMAHESAGNAYTQERTRPFTCLREYRANSPTLPGASRRTTGSAETRTRREHGGDSRDIYFVGNCSGQISGTISIAIAKMITVSSPPTRTKSPKR